MDGVIIKAIAGFFYVKTDEGVFACKARGKFKNKKFIPLVGDYVEMEITHDEDSEGVINKVHKRKNQLLRPPVCNVDQIVIVFAIKQPDPNDMLLDKMLLLAEHEGLESIIVLNKADLDDGSFQAYYDRYTKAGYKIIETSTETGDGVEYLKYLLKDKISAFAGPSGVGKSSLLNSIQPGLKLKTGEISQKIKRGKHTTRHSELMVLDGGGMVVDTPGFTSLNIDHVDLDLLREYYHEFTEVDPCKFSNCMHINEPDCNVKYNVLKGRIDRKRYDSYLYFVDEVKNGGGRKW